MDVIACAPKTYALVKHTLCQLLCTLNISQVHGLNVTQQATERQGQTAFAQPAK